MINPTFRSEITFTFLETSKPHEQLSPSGGIEKKQKMKTKKMKKRYSPTTKNCEGGKPKTTKKTTKKWRHRKEAKFTIILGTRKRMP